MGIRLPRPKQLRLRRGSIAARSMRLSSLEGLQPRHHRSRRRVGLKQTRRHKVHDLSVGLIELQMQGIRPMF